MAPPSGPFTDSLKKERSSKTPCEGVRAVLAGYRAAYRGRVHRRTSSARLRQDHHGLEGVGAVIEIFPLAGNDGLADAEDGVLASAR